MDDSVWLFQQYGREKKSMARSATHRVCGSKSRKCSLPCDGLTKKELREMNGDVVTYNVKKPMTLKVFKSMPTELQVDYLKFLIGDKKAMCRDIADMFQCDVSTMSRCMKVLRVDVPNKKRRTAEERKVWAEFIGGVEDAEEQVEQVDVAANIESIEVSKVESKKRTVYAGGANTFRNVDMDGIDDIVRWLKFVVRDGMDITITIVEGEQ